MRSTTRSASPSPSSERCPCGLPAPYPRCCGRLHDGSAAAARPEELMRSRYSAFVRRDEAYLLRTWHPETRPDSIDFDPSLRWLGLTVLHSTDGGTFGTDGTVEFRARYRDAGGTGELHERSRFTRHEGRWVYVDGVISD
ncbi:hypothetical protein H3146_17375 [Streptomyces sp. OF3]|uniref:UPF0225 protein H3146_17375 n=1 Tax=Streptomyces alkaliterrae TaxID=2213162 RepID=A0A7W3WMI7_9ACTN|nr:YchJ family metal-binding protein [Streptomyces alkaliterrae]MBB1255107.1 hypothetical protein [Streptomyces alkaliterrae]